jgi:hypothetical protein
MFEPVEPVRAAAPTNGLVRNALIPDDGERWQQGIAWRPERCPTATGFDPCGTEFTTAAGSGTDDVAYYRPVAFRVEDECTTLQRDLDPDRARRQAEAITSWMVARELELGAISQANPYETPATAGDSTAVNAYLASADAIVVPGGPHIAHVGLGLLEEATRDAQLGMDAWIHVPTRLVPVLADSLVRVGDMLFTYSGARVIADSGYSGVGPEGAGTSEVQTITITGGPTGGTFTLTYDGQVTDPLDFDASAGEVDSALEALTNLAPGDVTVTGGPGPDTPWVVTFAAALGNVSTLVANGSFTGGVDPAIGVVVTTPGVDPAPTAGSWMYATGPVQVRLDTVRVERAENWRTNTTLYVADRLFAATFDPCTLHAVSIEIPETS